MPCASLERVALLLLVVLLEEPQPRQARGRPGLLGPQHACASH